MKLLVILIVLICNLLFIQQSGFGQNETTTAKPESPENEELQSQKKQVKERKFSSRVEVIVSAPESIKDQVTSYVNRELRSLGDVMITGKNPQYRLRIVATEITTGEVGDKIGISYAVVLTEVLSWEGFETYHSLHIDQGDMIAIQLFFSDKAEAVEDMYLTLGQPDELRSACERIIARFDSDHLEKDRREWQESLEAEAKYPLVAAADRGDSDAVVALLEAGTDPNQRDYLGRTALMEAAYSSRNSIIRILLEHGADVNAQTDNGTTVLMFAVWGGWQYTVEFLLERGADPNLKDRDGGTALTTALREDSHSIIQLLKKAGAKEEKAPEKRGPSVNDILKQLGSDLDRERRVY